MELVLKDAQSALTISENYLRSISTKRWFTKVVVAYAWCTRQHSCSEDSC